MTRSFLTIATVCVLLCGIAAAEPTSWLWQVAAIRTPQENLPCQVLRDLESRMPARHPYRDGDKITWAHETTHGLNAEMRNALREQGGGRVQCLYLLGERCVVLSEPKNLTLRDVANAIPAAERGQVFSLYLVQAQAHWNDTPTYVLDEWTAYANGAQCGIEMRLDHASELRFANEFTGYARVLARLTTGPAIQQFVEFHAERVRNMGGTTRGGTRVYAKIFVDPRRR